MKLNEIWIRDPFVLADISTKTYYLYGSTEGRNSKERAFCVYTSKDLVEFSGPKVVFDADTISFGYDRDFWAPEVHFYNGKYYMFASFKKDDKCRCTLSLVCDTPDGTFKPLSLSPLTPEKWECLDGTLYIENGEPYLIFSHEWLQIYDGEICAVKLSNDLSKAIEKPFTLFKASDDKFVTSFMEKDGKKCYVTDGPFVYKEKNENKMIWSSFVDGKYAVLKCNFASIMEKVNHEGTIFSEDGGHAMVFTTFKGERKIIMHRPNIDKLERPILLDF